jgi:threonine/homoserine/homoserine lactone efflux protein
MELPVDPARFAAYLGVTAVMVVAPGPANLFAIAVGARRGPLALMGAVAGMNLGSVIWFVAAGLGLGAVALAFPQAFRLLAWLGAAYLVWLGWQQFRAAAAQEDIHGSSAAPKPGRLALVDGLVVQLANPKALLFTTAVLPPFLDMSRPLAPQLLIFAAAGMAGDVVVMTAYGLGGVALARRMAEPPFRRGFGIFAGLLLIGAAVLVAWRG